MMLLYGQNNMYKICDNPSPNQFTCDSIRIHYFSIHLHINIDRCKSFYFIALSIKHANIHNTLAVDDHVIHISRNHLLIQEFYLIFLVLMLALASPLLTRRVEVKSWSLPSSPCLTHNGCYIIEVYFVM